MSLSWRLEIGRGAFELSAASGNVHYPLGLSGASGSGKTTLLLALAGLIRPRAGEIRLGHRVLCDTDRGIHVPAHARRVGLVFQDARLFPHLSVEGNLDFARRRRHSDSIDMSDDAVIDLLDLRPLLHRMPRTLSGGERQRVGIGRTLFAAPEALLLDEPLASVDDAGRGEAMRLVRRVQEAASIPIVYVTHDVDEMMLMCRNVIWLEQGRESARGALPELLAARSDVRDMLNVLTFDRTGPSRKGMARCRLAGTGVNVTARAGREPATVASVAATDIALSTTPVTGVSIQNQMPGTVTAIRPASRQTWVEVDVGVPLVASVGAESVAELSLAPGSRIWCLIKATAIRPRF